MEKAVGGLKINGYQVIAGICRWEEWSVVKEEDGYIRFGYQISEQDELDPAAISEWTFSGGEYYASDETFTSFEDLEKFLINLPQVKEEA